MAEDIIEIPSLVIPPMEKTKILYISTMVEVTSTLCLKSWGLPNDMNTVFAASAMIISKDIGPCHESAPTKAITSAKAPAEKYCSLVPSF